MIDQISSLTFERFWGTGESPYREGCSEMDTWRVQFCQYSLSIRQSCGRTQLIVRCICLLLWSLSLRLFETASVSSCHILECLGCRILPTAPLKIDARHNRMTGLFVWSICNPKVVLLKSYLWNFFSSQRRRKPKWFLSRLLLFLFVI